ncbi:MAG: YjgN family protein [Verrucomicrobiota bacterium]
MDPVSLNLAPTPRKFNISFNGTAGEYFKIWIVNVALTVLTLGLYYPWAKVRTRRYFYANTELDGHRFDYLADPKNMLKGYLLIYSAIIIYVLGINQIIPIVIGGIMIFALGILSPYFIAASLRFWMHNTSYRNVRFHFNGTTGDAYGIFWGYGLLSYITLGILFPYMRMKISDYVFGNVSLGKSPFFYKGEAGAFYKIYLTAFAIIVGFIIAVLIIFAAGTALFATAMEGSGLGEGAESAAIIGVIAVYLLYIPAFILISGFIGAKLLQYNYSVLSLGYNDEITFESDITVGRYIWVTFTSIIVTILTLGLASPWAKVRATKMVVESISLESKNGSLGSHEALAASDQSATGEAASDAMDFDLGF